MCPHTHTGNFFVWLLFSHEYKQLLRLDSNSECCDISIRKKKKTNKKQMIADYTQIKVSCPKVKTKLHNSF